MFLERVLRHCHLRLPVAHGVPTSPSQFFSSETSHPPWTKIAARKPSRRRAVRHTFKYGWLDGWPFSLPAWIAFGSGRGIGTGRGTHGGFARSCLLVGAGLPLLSFGVVAFERSGQYVAAGAVSVVGALAMCCRDLSSRPPTDSPCGAMGSRPRGRSSESPGRHLHLWSGGGCPRRGRERCGVRRYVGRCGCDCRSDRVTAGPVRDRGRLVGISAR